MMLMKLSAFSLQYLKYDVPRGTIEPQDPLNSCLFKTRRRHGFIEWRWPGSPEELFCSTWNKMVEIIRCYKFSSGLGRPIRTNRRWDSGILTAGFQIQPGVEETLVESSPPSHSITCPRRARAVFAQRRMSGNPPTARAVTSSAKSGATRASSNRTGITSTFSNSSALTTSDRNAHFFLLDSINVRRSSGHAIFSARPGNPAPEPMSASRHLSTGIKLQINMDSPKWRAKISAGSTTEVKLTE